MATAPALCHKAIAELAQGTNIAVAPGGPRSEHRIGPSAHIGGPRLAAHFGLVAQSGSMLAAVHEVAVVDMAKAADGLASNGNSGVATPPAATWAWLAEARGPGVVATGVREETKVDAGSPTARPQWNPKEKRNSGYMDAGREGCTLVHRSSKVGMFLLAQSIRRGRKPGWLAHSELGVPERMVRLVNRSSWSWVV